MKFTTPEDYAALMESIDAIDSKTPNKPIMESVIPKLDPMFESISDENYIEKPEQIGYIDTHYIKYNLEAK